ncbi:hypothetical protein [Kitasatospora sp. LaBMicrA B282]|uniref:hypothetical protein n=1 Tax=Kitasatospora sp. LaBMicrA B282 TaxID=3420949 RepID=UPI003D13DEB8
MTAARGVGGWLTGAAGGLLLAAALFCYGALSGFTRAGKACALAAGRSPSDPPDRVQQTLLPLSHVCRWPDGTHVDLVQPWLNPLLALCVAVAIGCTVRTALVIRAARTPSEEHA